MGSAVARVAALLALAALAWAEGDDNRTHYGFYRGVGGIAGAWGARRVFGGTAAQLSSFPGACVLLDRAMTARCSAAVLAPRWALTAAHCIYAEVLFVKYNTRRPFSAEGQVVPIDHLFRHPSYQLAQADEGYGLDVTLLHHDVGLVRTAADMRLAMRALPEPLRAARLYHPDDLTSLEVEVMGFGLTERGAQGEELFRVALRLASCQRRSWVRCLCGLAAGREPRGVCSGDSGGPVLYRGVQVGVTSMGPLECAKNAYEVPSSAVSVITMLYDYVPIINATMYGKEGQVRMRHVSLTDGGERLVAPLVAPLAALLASAAFPLLPAR